MKKTGATAAVREETPGDFEEVRRVNEAAFGRADEAELATGALRGVHGLLKYGPAFARF
jgi:hypothetical protein